MRSVRLLVLGAACRCISLASRPTFSVRSAATSSIAARHTSSLTSTSCSRGSSRCVLTAAYGHRGLPASTEAWCLASGGQVSPLWPPLPDSGGAHAARGLPTVASCVLPTAVTTGCQAPWIAVSCTRRFPGPRGGPRPRPAAPHPGRTPLTRHPGPHIAATNRSKWLFQMLDEAGTAAATR
jgi:hypothetical protein